MNHQVNRSNFKVTRDTVWQVWVNSIFVSLCIKFILLEILYDVVLQYTLGMSITNGNYTIIEWLPFFKSNI